MQNRIFFSRCVIRVAVPDGRRRVISVARRGLETTGCESRPQGWWTSRCVTSHVGASRGAVSSLPVLVLFRFFLCLNRNCVGEASGYSPHISSNNSEYRVELFSAVTTPNNNRSYPSQQHNTDEYRTEFFGSSNTKQTQSKHQATPTTSENSEFDRVSSLRVVLSLWRLRAEVNETKILGALTSRSADETEVAFVPRGHTQKRALFRYLFNLRVVGCERGGWILRLRRV